MALSQGRLRKLLDYDPVTGIFTWRVNGRGRYKRAGARAGTIKKRGHRQICIDCVIYMAGPLAVLWMTGRWPKKIVDHANGIADDDRWSNIREANHSQNGSNSRELKGVTYSKRDDRWRAAIKVNYRLINLGRFDSAHDAHAAYLAAARKHFGEFARG
jgi:HNH endonuclease/AP2 domain